MSAGLLAWSGRWLLDGRTPGAVGPRRLWAFGVLVGAVLVDVVRGTWSMGRLILGPWPGERQGEQGGAAMRAEALKWVADALVLLGLVAVTVTVVGIIRLPGILMRVHAAGQAVFVGVVIILMGAVGSGQWPLMGRALLVAVFLMLTAPMSAHAIARAAAREQGEPAAEEVDAGE